MNKSLIHEGARRGTKKHLDNILNIWIPFVSASCPFVDKKWFIQFFHTFSPNGGTKQHNAHIIVHIAYISAVNMQYAHIIKRAFTMGAHFGAFETLRFQMICENSTF
ncbi:MAG: hypothetical protein A3G34_06640 [Candidatus Lindowbacteria bacterium RIFCSPLOWO2_12_FULL_62_27]|nr:MAG: hypothetical protein A3G34_06640 [Candidatus Lindowbacteria bacterium RIFCSPLOWO2_12_FULL_62_27]OGH63062.1 MAG: hypothetical protein A3I06_16545 [Candidatus Lindowbacteria bacterium RIFCSPLOWO2_02_FULL_62_12]